MNPVSATAQVINALSTAALQAGSMASFLHLVEAVALGLLLSPAKQNLIENYLAPFCPWYVKAILPLVLGGILTAVATKVCVAVGIAPQDALTAAGSFGVALTGGTYAFNGSSSAADKSTPAS
jgi:hypothetical protein